MGDLTRANLKEIVSLQDIINPIQDGLFRGCSRMGEEKGLSSLKSVTHILQ